MTRQEFTQFLKNENELTQVMNYIQSGSTGQLEKWAKTHNLPLSAKEITDICSELNDDVLQGISGGRAAAIDLGQQKVTRPKFLDQIENQLENQAQGSNP